MNTLGAGSDERITIQNCVYEILHQDGMPVCRIFERELHFPNLRLGKPKLGGFTELEHVAFISREVKAVIFKNDLDVGAGDFESVGAGSFASRGNERARGAISVFKVSGNIVLH